MSQYTSLEWNKPEHTMKHQLKTIAVVALVAPVMAACASKGSAGGESSSPVSRASTSRTGAANSGGVLGPVPLARPPSEEVRTINMRVAINKGRAAMTA